MTAKKRCLALLAALFVSAPWALSGCNRETPDDNVPGEPAAETTPVADPAVAYANENSSTGPDYREGYFGSPGRRLHYVETGAGELVILYHGFPSFWYSFYDQMEALKSRYRVVAVDGLGSGLSDKPGEVGAYTVQALATQLDAFSRHVGGEDKFILIGHDWGSALSLTYAEAYPERLRAVIGMSAPSYNVLLDMLADSEKQRSNSEYMQRIRETPPGAVVADPPGERIWQQSYGGLIASGDLTVAEGELFRQALLPAEASNGGFNWYRANTMLPSESPADRYWPVPPASIKPPALFIVGSDDKIFIAEMEQRMVAAADDLQVVTLPGIGHWTSMQDAGQSIRAIEAFLAELESGR